MKNPIIGITLDYENNGGYSKFPWYAIRENYLSCLHKFGAIPFPLFHQNSVNDYFLKTLDGLVITGGNFDIDPQLYSKFSNGSRNIKDKRTNYEIDIFHKFLETSKPILGICGGEQLMNVASGGDLIQDINHSIKTKKPHHFINSEAFTVLYRMLYVKALLLDTRNLHLTLAEYPMPNNRVETSSNLLKMQPSMAASSLLASQFPYF